MGYCVQNFGYKFHIPSKLCLQSTGNKYHNILDAYAGYKKQKAKLQKNSRRAHYFIYKEKKKKNIILDVYCVQNFGYKFHIPSKLCFQSTGNKYHNILDAYAGYKKQKAKLPKNSRRAHYFIYKE